MKVSEREILKQMKVSKTAVPKNIKNFKKSTFKDSKKKAIRAFLAVEINVLSGREGGNLL